MAAVVAHFISRYVRFTDSQRQITTVSRQQISGVNGP
jgi:hypothetical protein